jgi:cobalamin biosynthesis protein CobD/CbiB
VKTVRYIFWHFEKRGKLAKHYIMIFSDRDLSQKLERTEARSNVDFVRARAEMFPSSGAEWMEAAGAYAMFDGI